MDLFSYPEKAPYFAVSLSSKLILNDMIYRIMTDKMLDLAKEQADYLGAECALSETDMVVTYWQTRQAAESWLDHEMHRKVLSIAEQFWYEGYSLKLFEVLSERSFVQTNKNIHASRFPRIVTERGILTVLKESQAHLLHDYVNQEKAFLAPWEPLRSEAYYSFETCQLRVKEMRRDFLEDKGLVLCLLSPDESKVMAYSNYTNIIRGVFQACNLGYSLRESEQGKGIMLETLSAGLDYLHKELKINRIQANYMPRNARSAAVLKKLGFEKEGVAKDYLKINGRWEDHIITAQVKR
ncbi:GNAT family N-acetyltransferase [Marinomonas transparens]|uniref:GNAT family N-acetyltransferase n=1 Tax=Marinomonas transparens TaxID=2795388 RepID=A0A934N6X3_9GAMM|nr:GNAT family N-acetyltransferase [Marinomonas transparens]MBJ7538481.1 GNAT family N-acetyltransferase [Marinomonas transparens]